MPVVRIATLEGKSPRWIKAVADGVHEAMVECFHVPPKDRFQAIDLYRPGELLFDETYLGGPRSSDYVLIQITAGKARSQTTKEAFYRRVVEKLVESPGIRKEDVMIVVNTTGPDDWSFANGVMQYMTPIEGAKS
jgi:phenylpyruvate tautomerase PptA (4-oxalocrotonate tautomerase family)